MHARSSTSLALFLLAAVFAATIAPLSGDEPEFKVASPPSSIDVQSGRSSKLPAPTAVPAEDRAAARETAILKAISQTVIIDFDETPLSKVLNEFKQQLRIEILTDRSPEVPIDLDKGATIHVHDISGRAALDILLEPLGLDWTVHHEVLWIANYAKIKEMTTVKVYDVTDILASPEDPNVIPDIAAAVEAITSTVSTTSWMESGGNSSISPFNAGGANALVVNADRRTHEGVVSLLRQLQHIRRGKPRETSHPADSASENPAPKFRNQSACSTSTAAASSVRSRSIRNFNRSSRVTISSLATCTVNAVRREKI